MGYWVMRAQALRRLKFSDLRLLKAVIDSGSMARAARQLNISQPAVSKAIIALERTVGVPLVDRTPRGVAPTNYGEVLLKGAAAVFDDLSQSLNQIQFLSDPTVGDLRFGTIEHLIAGFVPAVIARLSQSYPRLNYYVEEISLSQVQYRELRERNVEFVVTRLQEDPPDPDINVEVLFDDPIFVAAGRNSPWAKRRRIRLSEIVNEPWSHPPYGGTMIGPVIIEAFRREGLEPPQSVSCFNMQMHMALMATGRYLAILPSSLLRFGLDHRSIKRLPIVLSRRPAPVGIISLKNRTMNPIAKLFIECSRQIVKETPPL
jgi:DNA-binding transcriptional LysR family regulator